MKARKVVARVKEEMLQQQKYIITKKIGLTASFENMDIPVHKIDSYVEIYLEHRSLCCRMTLKKLT